MKPKVDSTLIIIIGLLVTLLFVYIYFNIQNRPPLGIEKEQMAQDSIAIQKANSAKTETPRDSSIVKPPLELRWGMSEKEFARELSEKSGGAGISGIDPVRKFEHEITVDGLEVANMSAQARGTFFKDQLAKVVISVNYNYYKTLVEEYESRLGSPVFCDKYNCLWEKPDGSVSISWNPDNTQCLILYSNNKLSKMLEKQRLKEL